MESSVCVCGGGGGGGGGEGGASGGKVGSGKCGKLHGWGNDRKLEWGGGGGGEQVVGSGELRQVGCLGE